MEQDSQKNPSDSKRPRKRRRRPRGKPKDTNAAQEAIRHSSTLDKSAPDAKSAQTPLTPDEVAEMKEHLRFLFNNRKKLQLKVNAKEDLLLNGSRDPSERGVCMHLLGKVDRACVEKSIEKIQNPTAKSDLLQGIVRFSSDIGILILYLESLRESQSQEAAAAALSLGLKRIDFTQATKNQMARVLDLILTLFDPNDLPQLLFGFLQSDSFREAFDHSSDRLPHQLGELFVPIREVYGAVVENQPCEHRALLRKGLNLLFGSAKAALTAYPETVRARLFEHAMALSEKAGDTDPILQRLFDSFPAKERLSSRLGMMWCRALLLQHNDSKASKVLNRIATHHPDFALPRRWLDALKQPRAGRVALSAGSPTEGIQPGFWLDHQRPVLIRMGSADDAEQMKLEEQLHRSLIGPGIAPFLSAGTASDGRPFVAVDHCGSSAARAYQKRQPLAVILEHLDEGVRLLWLLSQAGVTLPDCNIERFAVGSRGRLWLVDLSGAQRAGSSEVFVHNFLISKQWCRFQLENISPERRPLFCSDTIEQATNFQELIKISHTLR
ncbi:MAG: hypothetical protein VX699_14055 [Myxococcota bacterium]|nr:hypothetical protein [Myxococcota bacterium]